MPDFNPQPNETITIGGQDYTVAPHPAVPAFAFGQEGRKAYVFQLVTGGEKYALKKFKPAYRVPELVTVNDELAQFARWRGLEVANRRCLTADTYSDVLATYPDLEYAVLMPWITGSTWYDLVIAMTPLTRLEALTFATGMVDVLAGLEEAGLAHCDIAAANVIINPTTGQVHLIDIEDIYAPGFQPPAALPAGTDGYAHKTSSGGQWGPHADRFAGAVITAEMLAWHDQRIRKASEEEHYFKASEMQQDTADYRLMLEVLGAVDERLAELFTQAWESETLADAPGMRAWQEVLQEVQHREKVASVASSWRPIVPGGGQPEQPEAEEETPQPEPPAPQPAQQPPVVQTPMPPPAAPAPVVVDAGDEGGPVVEWRPLSMSAPPPPSGTGASEDENGTDQQAAAGETITPPRTPKVEFEPLQIDPLLNARTPEGTPDLQEVPDDELAHDYDDVGRLMQDEGPWDPIEEEPVIEEAAAPPPPEVIMPAVDELPVELEPEDAGEPLIAPQLDYNDIDRLGRPHLVWTTSYGAEAYLLQEAKSPKFDNPREFTIEATGDTTWNPPLPRSGRLFYRIKAVAPGRESAWSEVVGVRVGER